MLFCITSHISRSAENIALELEKKGVERIHLDENMGEFEDIKGWDRPFTTILSSLQQWHILYRRPHTILLSVVPKITKKDISSKSYIEQYNKYHRDMATVRKMIFTTRENFIEVEEVSDVSFLLEKKARPEWERYFISIAQVASMRSNCMKRRVGAVLVKNNRVVGVGYNGTSTGTTNCCHGGCERCNSNTRQGLNLENCFCIHAEESIFLEVGSAISYRSDLYTTLFPCRLCSRKIVQLKVKKVYYIHEYGEDKEIRDMFYKNNVAIEKLAE